MFNEIYDKKKKFFKLACSYIKARRYMLSKISTFKNIQITTDSEWNSELKLRTEIVLYKVIYKL